MPCLPGDRIPLGSSASLIVSFRRRCEPLLKSYCSRDQVHELQVGAVLAVAARRPLPDQHLEQLADAARLLRVGGVEQDHEDVVQEAGAARQPRAVVEPELLRPRPHHLDLRERVRAPQRRQRREADVPRLALQPVQDRVGHHARDAGLGAVGRLDLRLGHIARVLPADDLRARDASEGLLHAPVARLDDVLGPDEPEPEVPPPDPQRVDDALDRLPPERPRLGGPPRTLRRALGDPHRVGGAGAALDRLVELQRAQRVDHRDEVVVARERDLARPEALGLGHEPEAQLRDDPVVGLHEQAVQRRAEAALVDVPRAPVADRTHPGAYQVAVGQQHLQAADGGRVLAVRRLAEAALERVADDAAPSQTGCRHPQRVAALAQVRVEIEERHAGLQQRVAEVVVDLEDPVHPAELDDHGAAHAWRGAAVAQVAAA